MKTAQGGQPAWSEGTTPAPIVRLAAGLAAQTDQPWAVAGEDPQVQRARAFAEPLLSQQPFDTGEEALAHADGVCAILQSIGAGSDLRAAVYLVYAGDYLARPEEVVTKAFGGYEARLVMHTRRLVQIQRSARDALGDDLNEPVQAEQLERVRKMLLAFSRDLRVVLLRLASRLQTLRYYVAARKDCPKVLAQESLKVFAPLANRLGIWQIKWQIEDLAFRFLHFESYQQVARLLDEKRIEREASVELVRQQLADVLARAHIPAQVQGRPKHLYSIWKKMRGKGLSIERVFDLRALRVIVPTVGQCYLALAKVHDGWHPIADEFDDYIARPKPNGYQSLHTVVVDDQGRSMEVQIRTQAMHEHAESGVAAHWAYKEAGTKGYEGVVADGGFESQIAQARKAVLHQLLAWERDVAAEAGSFERGPVALFDDRIYVFSPQGAIIDLPKDATPIDFAYAVHTDLGHRCRGAKVDGVMVSLNTPLLSGQTVEINTVRDGAPSLDWLNPELAYMRSPRARAKVRAWFNAQAQRATVARGRELVERLLQREGRTALKLDDLATQLGFRSAEALFEVVGKDELSLRTIEQVLRPVETEPALDPDAMLVRKINRSASAAPQAGSGGVLVVGMDSLLTQLAHCCRPAPPDGIGGFVTRGRGVSVHRSDCSNFRQLTGRFPERVIAVAWGGASKEGGGRYNVDVAIHAHDRPGLLRDISEILAQDRLHVSGVNSQSYQHTHGAHVQMHLTVQVSSVIGLNATLARIQQVQGVQTVRRR